MLRLDKSQVYLQQAKKVRTSVLVALLVLLLCIVGVYGYLRYVAFPNPENCKVCHYIAPFYEKWATSSHKKVPCLKCHVYSIEKALASQFLFLAGAYNPRPLSNVPDENCLQKGCHDNRFAESKVIFTRLNIEFDHRPHFKTMMRGIKLHCRSCHSDIVQGEHVRVSKNVCFLCHFKGALAGEAVTGCPSCHTAPKEVITVDGRKFSHSAALAAGKKCGQCHVEVVRGDGVTPKDRCFFCHVDRTEKYNDVTFLHEKHVGRKQVDCLWCHEKISHGRIKMARGLL
jgi:hypothetical protein